MSLDSFARGDLIMNKNICLVLAIIFIVLVVMGSGAYSWSQQNIKRQKEATISTWTDWIECGDIKKINNGPENQPHYAILVDLNTEYIGSQDWRVNMVNEEENYPPKFKITEGQIDYTITSSESGLLTRIVKRRIDGRIYCREHRGQASQLHKI